MIGARDRAGLDVLQHEVADHLVRAGDQEIADAGVRRQPGAQARHNFFDVPAPLGFRRQPQRLALRGFPRW